MAIFAQSRQKLHPSLAIDLQLVRDIRKPNREMAHHFEYSFGSLPKSNMDFFARSIRLSRLPNNGADLRSAADLEACQIPLRIEVQAEHAAIVIADCTLGRSVAADQLAASNISPTAFLSRCILATSSYRPCQSIKL